jgi:nucleoside-diphosphate-sugar epimerase
VKDVAAALTLLGSSPLQDGERVNVASGVEVSIAELARVVSAHLDSTKAIQFTGARHEGNPTNWRADVGILEGLGFRSRTTLDTGICEVANWVQSELSL